MQHSLLDQKMEPKDIC